MTINLCLSQLVFKQALPTQTSMQINQSVLTLPQHAPLTVVDVPGHPRIRGQFKEHMLDARTIIFVVDASTVSRNAPAVAEYVLHKFILCRYHTLTDSKQTLASHLKRRYIPSSIAHCAIPPHTRTQSRSPQTFSWTNLRTTGSNPRTYRPRARARKTAQCAGGRRKHGRVTRW